MSADAAEDGLREALEWLHHPIDGCECDRGCAWPGDDGRCAPPTRCEHCRTPWPCRTGALLAEHQPTAREACTCGYGGFHEPLNKRCAAYDPSHPDIAQPAPVAPAGGVGLSEEERGQILDAVLDDRSRAEGYTVLGPGGTDGQTPTVYEAVERILAARLAAAEQRVTEAKAEALREAADVGLAEAYGAGAIDNDAARWLRDRAADIRREATGEGGGA